MIQYMVANLSKAEDPSLSVSLRAIKQKSVIYFVLLYTFLFILAQLPIWLNQFLPLQDYPNHLARMHVILNYDSNPLLQEYYRINFAILPNLAMDIIVPFLARIFGLEIAGKLMIVLNIFMLTSGSAFLSYVIFKRVNYWSLVTFLAVYNQAFIISFINFLFGVGFALWGIGFWILMRQQNPWLRLILFNILTSALFICHLYGLGIYGLVVVSYEAYLFFKQKKYLEKTVPLHLLVIFGQFAIAAIFYLSSPTSGGESVQYLTPIFVKLKYVKMRMTDNYEPFLDLVTIVFIAIIPIVGLFLRKLRFSPLMILPLSTVTLAYLFIPAKAVTSSHADWRILVPLFFLFLSSIEFKTRGLFRTVILTSLIALFACRIYVINAEWSAVQSEYREILAAIAQVKEGSRLFSARGFVNYYQTIPFIHAPTYAVIKKSAFVPSFFAFATQQPVEFNPEFLALAEETMATGYEQGEGVKWNMVIDNYDYVLLSNEELIQNKPVSNLERVYKSEHTALYKVKASEN
jgi:hypothetical protein